VATEVWALGVAVLEWFQGERAVTLDFDTAAVKIQHEKYFSPTKLPAYLKTLLGEAAETIVGQHLTDLLLKMLVWDPTKRLTMAQVLEHPLYAGQTPAEGKVVAIKTYTITGLPSAIFPLLLNGFLSVCSVEAKAALQGTGVVTTRWSDLIGYYRAIDLLYRCHPLLETVTMQVLAIACLSLALETVNLSWSDKLNLHYEVPVAEVVAAQLLCLRHLDGIVLRPSLLEKTPIPLSITAARELAVVAQTPQRYIIAMPV